MVAWYKPAWSIRDKGVPRNTSCTMCSMPATHFLMGIVSVGDEMGTGEIKYCKLHAPQGSSEIPKRRKR